MANNKSTDDKVFDVAKPGKTAATPSSRPVIVGHKPMLKDPMVKEGLDSSTNETRSQPTEPEDKPSGRPPAEDKSEQPATAPTVARIKIEPLSEGEEVKTKKEPKNTEKETKAAPKAKVEDSISDEPVETTGSETTKQEKPPEEKPNESEDPTTSTNSDSATVEAVAGQAEQIAEQKKSDKNTQEEAARRATVESLIAQKKYFVPIKVASRKRQNRWATMLLVLLLLAVAGYLAIDGGLVDLGFKLPIEIIKN